MENLALLQSQSFNWAKTSKKNDLKSSTVSLPNSSFFARKSNPGTFHSSLPNHDTLKEVEEPEYMEESVILSKKSSIDNREEIASKSTGRSKPINTHPTMCSNFSQELNILLQSHIYRHHNTTFGKSNRSAFLSELTKNPPRKAYRLKPISGKGGCAHPELGLTSAGSPGKERILAFSGTFGNQSKALKNEQANTKHENGKAIEFKPISFDGPKSILDILHIKHSTNVDAIYRDVKCRIDKSQRNTRYSANTEWGRKTECTVQAPENSHFYINEKALLINFRIGTAMFHFLTRKQRLRKNPMPGK